MFTNLRMSLLNYIGLRVCECIFAWATFHCKDCSRGGILVKGVPTVQFQWAFYLNFCYLLIFTSYCCCYGCLYLCYRFAVFLWLLNCFSTSSIKFLSIKKKTWNQTNFENGLCTSTENGSWIINRCKKGVAPSKKGIKPKKLKNK